MTKNLKPCPFCGGKAAVHELETRTSSIGGYYVICTKCLTSSNNYSTPEIAAERWNRRVKDESENN